MSDDGPSDGRPRMGHHGNKSKSPVLPDYGLRPASASGRGDALDAAYRGGRQSTPVCLAIGASMFKRMAERVPRAPARQRTARGD